MKRLKVKITVVSFDNGHRIERPYESLSEEERNTLAVSAMRRAMSAAGYIEKQGL